METFSEELVFENEYDEDTDDSEDSNGELSSTNDLFIINSKLQLKIIHGTTIQRKKMNLVENALMMHLTMTMETKEAQ